MILLIEVEYVLIDISLKFVSKGPLDNKSSILQVMAWYQKGDKPLPDPIMTQNHHAI